MDHQETMAVINTIETLLAELGAQSTWMLERLRGSMDTNQRALEKRVTNMDTKLREKTEENERLKKKIEDLESQIQKAQQALQSHTETDEEVNDETDIDSDETVWEGPVS